MEAFRWSDALHIYLVAALGGQAPVLIFLEDVLSQNFVNTRVREICV